MPAKPKLLDLYCCQGGASMGYHRAGFVVEGIDIVRQSRYPFLMYPADAIEYVEKYGHRYDAIAASPPCQRYTRAQTLQDNDHPDLIYPTRLALQATGKPYVIENVSGAVRELADPILLCGQSFGLRTYRHRLFESNVLIRQPVHETHTHPVAPMGRGIKPGEYYHAVGNFTDVELVRRDMDVPWKDRDGVRECIPPHYTEYIGAQLIKEL
jgi:DNA (cytosine-5)-methyltransferase 1